MITFNNLKPLKLKKKVYLKHYLIGSGGHRTLDLAICNSEYCMILNEDSRGFASRINPKTGKKEFCHFCFFCINEFMKD